MNVALSIILNLQCTYNESIYMYIYITLHCHSFKNLYFFYFSILLCVIIHPYYMMQYHMNNTINGSFYFCTIEISSRQYYPILTW